MKYLYYYCCEICNEDGELLRKVAGSINTEHPYATTAHIEQLVLELKEKFKRDVTESFLLVSLNRL